MHRVDAGDGSPVHRHDRRGSYHAWIDFDRRDPVFSTVISVVVATASEPLELSPLWTAVDTDALERLVAHWHRTDRPGPTPTSSSATRTARSRSTATARPSVPRRTSNGDSRK